MDARHRLFFDPPTAGGLYRRIGAAMSGLVLAALLAASSTHAAALADFGIRKASLLERSAGSDRFELRGTFRLGPASDGADPATEPVTLTVGSFSHTIREGGFRKRSSANETRWLFGNGASGLQDVVITRAGDGRWQFRARGRRLDLSETTNPIAFGLEIGDDRGSRVLVLTERRSAGGTEFSTPALVTLSVTEAVLTVEDGPAADGFKVRADFRPRAGSDEPDPGAEEIALGVGPFSLTLPPGSFAVGGSANHRTWTFRDRTLGLKIAIARSRGETDRWIIEASADQVDLTTAANPITIAFRIGNGGGAQTLVLDERRHGARTVFRFPPGHAVGNCGDGVLDEGEECDDGNLNDDTTRDACRTTCAEPRCGDGVVDTGETCDPPGDRCSADCLAACVPATEVCDGADNDCDGAVDEELGRTTCGLGPCRRTVDNCVGGVPQTCTPGDPAPEVCDGADNDCDGAADESLGQTTCGLGPCRRTVDNCVGGVPQTCTPGDPAPEVCDAIDNDCDGAADESLGQTTCGLGPCRRTVDNCVGGAPQTCTPGDPAPEVCDAIDNDCDGTADDSLGQTTCGLGACARTVENCVGGVPRICTPGDPTPEVCDGVDNDCDGSADEDLSECETIGITIAAPEEGLLTNAASVQVTGTISGPVTSVIVNGVAATLAASAFTADGVPLREGKNIVTALAGSDGGAAATASVTVLRDTTPPTVAIESPTASQVVITPTVAVVGTVNDAVVGTVGAEDCRVVLTGPLGPVDAIVRNRTFLVPAFPLRLGTNALTAVAIDTAGNESAPFAIMVSRREPIGQRIVVVSGNDQTGRMGEVLAAPIIVRAVGANGTPLANRTLTLRVVRNDGRLRESAATDETAELSVVTNASGEATVQWVLGTRAGVGNNRIEVSGLGFDVPALVCASATAGACEKLLVVAGENQLGLAGSPLARPLEVVAIDRGGNVCVDVPVTFRVEAGGGTINGAPSATVSTNADGRAAAVLTLGPAAGINNNVVAASFPDLAFAEPLFLASAAIAAPGAPARFIGTVLDTENEPIPNATVRIDSVDPPLETHTDAEGAFVLSDVPAGAGSLFVDGATTARPGRWPDLRFDIDVLPGVENSLGMPIFLPELDADGFQQVGGNEDVVLKMAGVEGFELKIFANSATFPGGTEGALHLAQASVGEMGVTQVSSDQVPMPPSGGAAPPWVGTLQPAGVHLNPPAQLTVPNSMGLPPGAIVDLFSFDHDLGQFVSVGTGTVQPDGGRIVSDPGSGITKSGWFFDCPPPPPAMTVTGVVVGPGGGSVGVDGTTVSTRNRTARVNTGGTFVIGNVPAAPGLFRVRAVSSSAGLLGGYSGFFPAMQGVSIDVGTIELGVLPPTIDALTATVDPTSVAATGEMARITVTARLSDGTMRDVTADPATRYVESNPAVGAVDTAGVVTAGTESGTLFVSITNDGVFTAISLLVVLSGDADGDGLPDDYERTHRTCLLSRVPDAMLDPDGDGLTNLQEFEIGTDPCVPDTDGDGLTDGAEVSRGTNPTRPDTDGDEIFDGEEVIAGADGFVTDPLDPDTDGDGLRDGAEVRSGFDPTDPNDPGTGGDLDGDGLSDDDERQLGTDPTKRDTDGDLLGDGFEVTRSFDPLDPDDPGPQPDTDGDGLDDLREEDFGTNPLARDSDGDGLEDGEEVIVFGTDPAEFDTDDDGVCDGIEVRLTNTNPLLADTDGDGLDDGRELDRGTDPFSPDTDGDGILDGAERQNGLNPLDPGDAALDLDGDGLDNRDEITRGTGLLVVDSDGDGLGDGEEVTTHGSDPAVSDTDAGGRTDGEEVVIDGTAPRDPGDDVPAVFLPRTGIDRDGARWDVFFTGEILNGSNAFGRALRLSIDAVSFPFRRTAVTESGSVGGAFVGTSPDDRELTIGPALLSGLRVQRKIFVPADDAFVRYLEVLDNPGSAAVTAAITIESGLRAFFGSSGPIPFRVLTSDGDSLLETSDDFIITDSSATGAFVVPQVVHAFSGPFAALEPSAASFTDALFRRGSATVSFTYEVTVPAGARVILMHFASQNADGPDAEASADHLVTQGGSARAGLSAAEAADVVNFVAVDADGDGLSDAREASLGTNPNDADTDDDGLTDGFEVAHGFDPRAPGDGAADADGDGLDNQSEQQRGTDPRAADTDGDGRADAAEVADGTNPRNADTDGDGLSDGDEIAHGSDPRDMDSDDDGLRDGDEVARGTDPVNRDTDGDGLADGAEVAGRLDPLDPGDAAGDPDDDGLSNADELARGTGVLNPDSDRDALTDGEEVHQFGTDPRQRDTDFGGRTDGEEMLVDGTDPRNRNDEQRFLFLPHTPRDAAGFTWPVNGDGEIGFRFGGAFARGLQLGIDGEGFPFQSTAVNESGSVGGAFVGTSPDDRELIIGPTLLSRLRVIRKVFVPADDAFARFLEILENPGTSDVTVSVALTSALGSNVATELVATSSGDLVFDVRDDSITTDDIDQGFLPAVVHAFSGPFARLEPASVLTTAPGGDQVGFSFTVTVPAGGRTILMHFASQRDVRTEAATSADRLVRLQGSARAGLALDEQADVVNFLALADADGDGLTDTEEAARGTDPNDPDTDGDGLPDGFEVANGFDPRNPGDGAGDADADGLDNQAERQLGTDPRRADTDGDGLGDGNEVNVRGTDPFNPDSDGDGLSDGDEVSVHGTDPRSADTDGDGLDDAADIARGGDPLRADTDDDGVPDALDNCTRLPNVDQADADNDGGGDACQPTVDIRYVLNDGPEIHVDAVLSDPNGDPLSGTVTIDSQVPVVLEASNGFRDRIEPPRFLERTGGANLLRSSSRSGRQDFLFACGPCDAPDGPFRESFRQVCGGSNSSLPGRDVCVQSRVTGTLYTLHFTAWAIGGGSPAAAYLRTTRTVGPVPYTASTLPGPLDVSRLPAGAEHTLAIVAGDGAGTPVVARVPITRGQESLLRFVTLPDGDGDGLVDAAETGTGTFVSRFDTGSSPDEPDTDGDGLEDGEEVLVLRTDPNDADSDGDGKSDGAEASVLLCLAGIRAGNLMAAEPFCARAADDDPDDAEANMLAAVTGFAAGVGRSPALQDALVRFGVTRGGSAAHLCGLRATLPLQIPPGTPPLRDLQQALRAESIPLLDAALARLARIPDDAVVHFDLDNLPVCVRFSGFAPIEIDAGELFAVRAAINAAAATMHGLAAYDVNFDLEDAVNNRRTMESVFLANPALGTLLTGGRGELGLARTRLAAALDATVAAVDAVDDETDDQANDVLVIAPIDRDEVLLVRRGAQNVRTALTGVATFPAATFRLLRTQRLAVAPFFNGDFPNLRVFMPPFDAFGLPDIARFPDPTVGGLAPDMTSGDFSYLACAECFR